VAADRHLYYLPAARAEFVNAASRYETAREGTGVRFIDTVEDALAMILAAPERWPLAPRVQPRRGARRYVLRRFPFSIIYRMVGEDDLEVIAVAHQKRRPGYWTRRLP
jgi:plasmid stabilization system protein ParE